MDFKAFIAKLTGSDRRAAARAASARIDREQQESAQRRERAAASRAVREAEETALRDWAARERAREVLSSHTVARPAPAAAPSFPASAHLAAVYSPPWEFSPAESCGYTPAPLSCDTEPTTSSTGA
jgi:hypothetical protein